MAHTHTQSHSRRTDSELSSPVGQQGNAGVTSLKDQKIKCVMTFTEKDKYETEEQIVSLLDESLFWLPLSSLSQCQA